MSSPRRPGRAHLDLYSVAYGSAGFVAVGSPAQFVEVSADGATWEVKATDLPETYRNIHFARWEVRPARPQCALLGRRARLDRRSAPPDPLASLIEDGWSAVGMTNSGAFWRSTDLDTWTAVNIPRDVFVDSIGAGAGRTVIVNPNGIPSRWARGGLRGPGGLPHVTVGDTAARTLTIHNAGSGTLIVGQLAAGVGYALRPTTIVINCLSWLE